MPVLTLPDGAKRAFDHPVSGADLAAAIGPGLAKAALAVKVDGEMLDLATKLNRDASVSIVTRKSPEALELLRHDAAHVLAEAAKELYPDVQVTFGPATEEGFYYDFAREAPFTPEDLAALEQRMHEIVDRDEPISREVGTATTRSATSRRSARSTRPSTSSPCRATRRSRSTARAPGSTSASARTCPRPRGWATPSSCCACPAPTGAATAATSSSSASTAPSSATRRS